MDKLRTWRELLGNCIDNPLERQRIADEVGVTPITLMRWVKQTSDPRPQNLHSLLDALPQYRNLLVELIDQEFAGFSTTTAADTIAEISADIPSEFYKRVHHTCATLPKNLRFSSLSSLILQQVLEQLDPQRLGMAAIVARCLPPSAGGKVRSLFEAMGDGTEPWRQHLEQHGILLGAESLAGYAVTSYHLVTNQNLRNNPSLAAGYRANWEESAAAAPILFMGAVAGSLLVSSTQPEYFLPTRCRLVEGYAELMALSFAPEEFYELQDIQLGAVPPYEVQLPYLSKFRQRTIETMLQAMNNQHPITYHQAEQLVWQQIEKELLEQDT